MLDVINKGNPSYTVSGKYQRESQSPGNWTEQRMPKICILMPTFLVQAWRAWEIQRQDC